MHLLDGITATSTIGIDSHVTNLPESFDDNHDMKGILSYAFPLSCFAILVVLLLIVAVHRRKHVLEKWSSLTRMKNTNPRFYERTGLRRDSEYESSTESYATVTTIPDQETTTKESDYRVATIA